MQTDTFRGGIHPLARIHEGKHMAQPRFVEELMPPKHLVIPLSQSAGTTCDPLVKKGDRVLRYQKIGEPRGFVGAPVHAPVSGTVLGLDRREVGGGVFCDCVLIESDDMDEEAPAGETFAPETGDAKAMIAAVREAGIVGMGGAAFPTHVKLSPPPGKAVDTVIINGAECEPYLTSDHAAMLAAPGDVVLGLRYAVKILGAKRGIVGIEKNKPDAICVLRGAIAQVGGADKEIEYSVRALRVKYPQGSEKHLISATTSRQVPSGGLPADAGCVVLNASTAIAIARALRDGRPLTERLATVTGRVTRPGNFSVRMGTPISALIEAAGGFLPDAGRLILGGPMMGIATFSTDFPVVKATGGILALSEEDVTIREATDCIHCGRCAQGCPMHMMPMKLSAASRREDWDACQKLHALDCMECGSCSYSCPAKIELLSNIRIAKRAVLARMRR